MLERNVSALCRKFPGYNLTTLFMKPQKDKILGKHEFSGNQNQLPPDQGPQRGGSSRGRGTRGGGGGRGGRGGRGAGGGAGNSARERANKDRNKASKANHNWKSGHDKKMARAGPPPM